MLLSRCVIWITALFISLNAVPASATTWSLLWVGASDPNAVGIGTSSIDVSGPGTTLTLDYVFGIDGSGVSVFGLDVEFDVGNEFDDELDILSFQELSWRNAKATRRLTQLSPGIAWTQESDSTREGQLFGFEAYTLGSGPINLTLSFARMVFVTTPRVQTDGPDLFGTNERDPLATAALDNTGLLLLRFPLPTARVNLIPEPATAVLLGVGLSALAVSAQRRRH